MRKNLDRLGGLVHSQRILIALTQKGVAREDAYRLVQRNAMKVWRGEGDFLTFLKADKDVRKHLSEAELKANFDLGHHFKHVDTIFKRVFGTSGRITHGRRLEPRSRLRRRAPAYAPWSLARLSAPDLGSRLTQPGRAIMSRLVRIPASAEFRFRHHRVGRAVAWWSRQERPIAGAAGDDYLERIAKYVPGEVLAFFIVINAILNQVVQTGGKGALMAGIPVMTVAQARSVVCLVLVPLFVWYVREKGDAWVINAVVSTLAFPFWAYALGATAFVEHWDGNLAAITAGDLHGRERTDLAAHAPAEAPGTRRQRRCRRGTERPQLDLVGPGPA